MKQLSGLDASFLYLETGNMPMHIGGLAIYDQSTAPGGAVTFKDILRFFEKRLHKARAFRQRLVTVPMSLDHPYWIDDPDFDLEFHVRHIALPKPGDWRQLCIQAARLHARPLDTNRPLWEAYVIEGLDNVAGVPEGSFALMTKFHHAAIDGVSGAEISAAIHDVSPEDSVRVPDDNWNPERFPTTMELLGRTAVTTAKKPIEFASLVTRNAPTAWRFARGLINKELHLTTNVPRTRFNGNVSPHRVFDARSFSLDEIRAIKSHVDGATVNDVMVSVCGGALRQYLDSKGELPEESLVAMAPVSARPEEQRKAAGNMVSTMSLPIRSDIAKPLDRLRAVHGESQHAKKLTRTVGASLVAELAHFMPSTTSGLMATAYGRYGLAKRLPPLYNTIITNVPGPNFPLYSMGSRMVASFGLGPIVHGLGLFQPVISYNGQITVSAISCREMMPDPAFYCDCLSEAFEDLKKSVKPPTTRTTKRRASKTSSGKASEAGASTGRKAKRKTTKKAGKAKTGRKVARTAGKATTNRKAAKKVRKAEAKPEATKNVGKAGGKAAASRKVGKAGAKAKANRKVGKAGVKAKANRKVGKAGVKTEATRKVGKAGVKTEATRKVGKAGVKTEATRKAGKADAKPEATRKVGKAGVKTEATRKAGKADAKPEASKRVDKAEDKPVATRKAVAAESESDATKRVGTAGAKAETTRKADKPEA